MPSPHRAMTERRPPTPAQRPSPVADPFAAWIDLWQRSALFVEALHEGGRARAEQHRRGEPPVLRFEHETVLDGATLPRPCNHALLRIVPPPGQATDAAARAVVVVDPRAGNGPGIGGFKLESEVGVALRAGHPVYFITFRPRPLPGQTLDDVLAAQAGFIDVVARRHPRANGRPLVIGNCQAGWAMAAVAARHPGAFGPLLLVGAPLSFWAGGARQNPMRHAGAMLGGAWPAALASDLGGGLFDGAHLVQQFEALDPARHAWRRYHELWRHVDTEAARHADFQRWWGGHSWLTGAEIESIVENLFVGNRLARGTMTVDGRRVDLRRIRSPIVVFASHSDRIAPPAQALNWIADVWGDERAIAAAGRTIIYLLHERVGHLGIFLAADVARREHDQIVDSAEVLEKLPPGLYEMILEPKADRATLRWEDLEPGDWSVHFEHRTIAQMLRHNPEGRDEEALFSTVAQWSEQFSAAYKAWLRPWLRASVPAVLADAASAWHPLRLQQAALPASPLLAWWLTAADTARRRRVQVGADDPLRQALDAGAGWVGDGLDVARELRDRWVVAAARLLYGPAGLGAWLPPAPAPELAARRRADAALGVARRRALAHIGEGGFAAAVCRIVLAGMLSEGRFERRSFRLAGLLARLSSRPAGAAAVDWVAVMRLQARIAAVAPVEALNALDTLLPTRGEREQALAVAAAVMMIEPTLAHPRSEIVEYLIGALGVSPARVMALARELTRPLRPASPRRRRHGTKEVACAS